MNIRIQKYIYTAILIILMISCKNSNQTNIIINNNEILVYYDHVSDDYKVLKVGEHNISTDYTISKYNLDETELLDNLRVMTKDEKSISLKISYLYKINEKEVIKLHEKYGTEILNRLILPQLRKAIRIEYKKIDFNDIKELNIRKLIMKNIKNEGEYSEMITSKDFIINYKINLLKTAANNV